MRLGFLRTAFLAVGLWHAAAGAAGEYFVARGEMAYVDGRPGDALMYFVRANAAYPLEPAIREREATIHAAVNVVAPEIVLAALDAALADDPHNPLLFWYGCIQALRLRNLALANGYLERLREIGPDWPETRNAEDVWKAVAEMVGK